MSEKSSKKSLNATSSKAADEHQISLPFLFDLQCKKTPDTVAVEFEDYKITYRELDVKSGKIATYLKSIGAGSDSLIGVCAERSPELVISILGIIKAGAAYVPFDPSYPAERISYMLEVAGISSVLVHDQFRSLFNTAELVKIIDKDLTEFETTPQTNSVPQFTTSQNTYVLFTSGSTGKPKGVVMGHGALVNLVQWHLSHELLGVPARTLQFSPISFDVSFQELFVTWSTGGTLVLIRDEMRLNASNLLQFIKEKKIERLFLPFIALQHLSEIAVAEKVFPSMLRDVITAGEQLQITRFIREFFSAIPGCRLHNHYGPTETHVVTTYVMEGPAQSWMNLPPIGKPIANSQILILSESMEVVPAGETGEIYVTGKVLANGYINQPELTSERFLKKSFDKEHNTRIYKTGDLGKLLSDGNIEYLGRADNQVKVRGYRIELGELEIVLGLFPGIAQAAVMVREDHPGDKRIVAYVIPEPGKKIVVSDIRKFMLAKVPDYMIPSAFVVLTSLPKTPSGKIDRKSLPPPGTSRPDTDVLYKEPVTTEQKMLARVWAELLHIDKVGIDDNFFELGGNSLLALQSIARLRHEYGFDLPVVKLYQHPTINSLLKSLTPDTGRENVHEIAQRRIAAASNQKSGSKTVEDGIAIIGMSGRFPGADDMDTFWKNLVEGKETITFFGENEIDPSVSPSIKNDPSYIKARGILKDADKFDAAFFGINPRLAELTDPQHRIFLEVCWEALENSGYTAAGFKGTIGVYAGTGNNTYYTRNVLFHQDAIEKAGSFQVMISNEKDYIATRVSHIMNLTGPGLSVHTACSTSLTAVVLACQGLWNHQCDMAVAGGTAITSPVNSGQLHQEGGMYSADGHTRPFDSKATGTVFSDGSGVVILKRYRDAVANGDHIYAVIRGAALNNDGASKASFTAPSVEGQAMVIAMAQADANISADSVTFIEAHGTATPLGDPIEVEALTQAFRGQTDRKGFCALGSVKSNFGHLTAAAGIAGLLKAALALQNKVIPPTINYEHPNSQIDFENTPFFVNNRPLNWETNGTSRRAGVSSFGVGGTNAHVVLEEAPPQAPSSASRSKQLLLLSAKGPDQLDQATANLKSFLKKNTSTNIADIAFTLQTGRMRFNHRRYVVCGDQDAANSLEEMNPLRSGSKNLQSPVNGVAFLFPGQGSQYVNMGSALYRDEIIFKDAVDRCAEILGRHIDTDIRTILFPQKNKSEQAALKLQQTSFTQPALFTIGYALSRLWMSWGIVPVALAGHSIGEFTAACISGIMSLEDALMLVAIRGKLMQSMPEGSMISVRLSATDAEAYLNNELSIAAINGPSLCVISGNDQAIDEVTKKLEQKNIAVKKLFTSHAFHSPMMDPVVEPFRKIVAGVKLNPPSIPVVSTATSRWLTAEEATTSDYWARHLRMPVRFAEAIRTIWSEYPSIATLEMGPRNTASILARQQITDPAKQMAVSCLPDNADNEAEWVTMLNATGQLWLGGIDINWEDFYALEKRKRIPLPAYPFEKKRYWVEPGVFHSSPAATINVHVSPQSDIRGNNLSQSSMNSISRKDQLISELRSVMEDASGIDLSSANSSVTFMELGMDSLFLTQAALTISKKYGTKVTFRQLNEAYASLDALAAYLDKTLPATLAQPVTPAAGISDIPLQAAGGLENLIMQQMKMMQDQLALLRGTSSIPAPENTSGTTIPIKNESLTEINENEKAELSKPFGAIARIEKDVTTELTGVQKNWLNNFIQVYNSKTARSKQYTQDHRTHLADPRVVSGFKPVLKELIYQVVVDRSKGCKIWDIDGNEYLDVLNGFGSNFLGYGNEIVLKAVNEQLSKGIELGPQHPLAGEVAKLICEFTGYDRAGFCNTGSEAVLGAMRIARTVTGRNLIVCFNGSYHGINDEVIVRGTKKLKSFPAAAGIMPESVQNMLVLDYGTPETLEIIKQRSDEIAAVMVEPIQSRRADFKPKQFIHELRKITEENGSLLIFDEVITGFRLLPGGAQEFFDVKADVGTYGKVIGGGMPIGVIAGKKEFMDALDGGQWQFGDDSVPQVGVTYFAGTFVRHPLALAAAKAVLEHIKERGNSLYEKLNGFTDKLVYEVNLHCQKSGAPFHLVSFGSLFKVKWDTEQPYGELVFLLLRNKGIHIYDGFPCFITDAFTEADLQLLINKFIETVDELQTVGFLASDKINQSLHSQNGKAEPGEPPVPGARLGKDAQGNPGWFIADPERPGKYKQVLNN